jgi:hypothetical protein
VVNPSAQSGDKPVPLRTGTRADYGRVAAALQVEEFSEAAVWKVLRQVGLKALGPQNYKEQQDLAGTERPNVLRRLFVELASIPQRELESVLDISTVKSFLALDLLRPSLDQQQYYAPVFLYPVADLIIASDRYNGPPGLPLFEESVYPAIESHSLRLLDLLPRRHISRPGSRYR